MPVSLPGEGSGDQAQFFTLEKFGSINTKAQRPAIDDQEFSWIENYMPIGDGNLRSLYSNGATLYTAPGGKSIICHFPFNIGNTQYICVFLNDGTAQQVQISNGAVVDISTTVGTFYTAGGTFPAVAQYAAQFLLIVASTSNNAYWLWSGSTLYGTGGLSPFIVVTNGGSGYTSSPTITPSGGSGSGATFSVVIVNQSVVSITVLNPGTGYKAGETVTLGFSGGGGTGAAATATIIPFGISGSTIEVFSSRVWIGGIGGNTASPTNGANVTFSAPSNPTNFATTSGGGTFQSSDSFLKTRNVCLRQSNGFLYLIGDSSINVISNVQTSGSPATTTFNNSNVDPQVGTPWRDSVQAFGRALVLAHTSGIYALYGGAAEKISGPLDGIFQNANFTTGVTPSSAVMSIFSIKVYMLLITAKDPFTGLNRNILCMWDGNKWFVGSQSKLLSYTSTQEQDSSLTAWGSDSTTLFKLFSAPSSSLTKTLQGKLWRGSNYVIFKRVMRAYIVAFDNASGDILSITMMIDTDVRSTSVNFTALGQLIFTNNAGLIMQFVNNSAQNIFFTVPGFSINGTDANAFGKFIGLTVTSQSQDHTIVSMSLEYREDSNYA